MLLKSFIKHFLFTALLVSFAGCQKHSTQVEAGFYYWKTTEWSLNDNEKKLLYETKAKQLYVKLFEVDVDPVFINAPISKTRFGINYQSNNRYDTIPLNMEMIPTVFIKNIVLLNLSDAEIDSLADNIFFLINKRMSIEYNEIQIDCDWTERTKDKYFLFLNILKSKSKKRLSCTLRLYAYTYPQKAGVPPADRVSLMCYNLLSPQENPDKNSILDLNELKQYLKNAKPYPIHVDIALPVFAWYHLYQNNTFKGLIPFYEIAETKLDKPFKPMWHYSNSDIETKIHYIREGDILKKEVVSNQMLLDCVDLLKKYIRFDATTRVTLFHLDDKNLSQYESEKIQHIFNRFTL